MHNLLVRYRAGNTLAALLAQYDRHALDEFVKGFSTDLSCDCDLPVEILDVPDVTMTSGTRAILSFVDTRARRCLNILEGLAFGLLVPDTRFVYLGQPHKGPCMEHALVTYQRTAGFTGFYCRWDKGHHSVPVTTEPDPLA